MRDVLSRSVGPEASPQAGSERWSNVNVIVGWATQGGDAAVAELATNASPTGRTDNELATISRRQGPSNGMPSSPRRVAEGLLPIRTQLTAARESGASPAVRGRHPALATC